MNHLRTKILNMDIEEYKNQVRATLAVLLDPKNDFLGTGSTLILDIENILETHSIESGPDSSGKYATKLMARSSTNTRAGLTRLLLE